MNLQYYPETDMLYIGLVDGVSAESEEVAPGIVLDLDGNNRVIGIELEDARPVEVGGISPASSRSGAPGEVLRQGLGAATSLLPHPPEARAWPGIVLKR